MTIFKRNWTLTENSTSHFIVDDSCKNIPWSVQMISVNANWIEEGNGNKRARIYLFLERNGETIASYDIFGEYNLHDK